MQRLYRAVLAVAPLILFSMGASANDGRGDTGTAVVSSTTPDILDLTKMRIAEAERFCETVTAEPAVNTDQRYVTPANPSGKKIVERPIILCAYKTSDDSWHTVTVYLPSPIPESYRRCIKTATTLEERARCVLPMRIATPGYDVERYQWGFGITRFSATVYEAHTVRDGDEAFMTRGEHLIVYRTKHLFFDDAALASGDTDRVLATMRSVYYTPYHPDFARKEIVAEGRVLRLEEIRTAQTALKRLNVPSLAYPTRHVVDAVPLEIPYALSIIEQLDDLWFRSEPERAIEAHFVETFLNGGDMCRYCQSPPPANAFGLMQFTNAGPNGTYTNVAGKYPAALLDTDFDRGARDHINSMKAAFCLIDYEVSILPDIQRRFQNDPVWNGIYPVAAYNGGNERARELYRILRAKKLSAKEASKAPQEVVIVTTKPCKKCQGGKKVVKRTVLRLNGETYGYVKKYLYVIERHL